MTITAEKVAEMIRRTLLACERKDCVLIGIDPGVTTAFFGIGKRGVYHGDIRMPKRELASGRKRSYLDDDGYVSFLNAIMNTAEVYNFGGPKTRYLFSLEDNGGPIGPGGSGNWTLAEIIGATKGALSALSSEYHIFVRTTRPAEWTKKLSAPKEKKERIDVIASAVSMVADESGLIPMPDAVNQHVADAAFIALDGLTDDPEVLDAPTS